MIAKVLSMFVLKHTDYVNTPDVSIVNHNNIGFYKRNGDSLKVLVKQDGAKENIGQHDHKCGSRSILKKVNVKTKSIMINEDP
jgi:hypothetical protein